MKIPKVMIATSEPDLTCRLKKNLGEFNCALLQETDTPKTQNGLEPERPDIVFIELEDSETTISEDLTQTYRGLNIPVIFVSETLSETLYHDLNGNKPYGFISKNFTKTALKATLDMALLRFEVERSLNDSGNWWSGPLEHLNESIFTTDQNGTITFMNKAAHNLTGTGSDDTLGQPISEIIKIVDGKTGRDLEVPVCNLLRGGHISGLGKNTLLKRLYDCDIPVELTGTLINSEIGSLAGALLKIDCN